MMEQSYIINQHERLMDALKRINSLGLGPLVLFVVDDQDCMDIYRLFNEPDGKEYLKSIGVKQSDIDNLALFGISGIGNMLSAIKMAKYYEFTEHDVIGTVLTDSAVMYGSRIAELNEMHGSYSVNEAVLDHNLHMLGLKTDNLMELTYADRKRVHNLKYYTWVEQQGKTSEELNALWYDTEGTWDAVHAQAKDLDALIDQFNEESGVLKSL